MKKTVLFLLFFSVTGLFAGPDDVLGTWLTEGGKSHVQIFKCGDRYCGRIAWLREPNDSQGQPKLDKENPDRSQQSRPILGMNLVWGFNHAGNNVWENGKIYNPEDGKTYSCKMTLNGRELNVRGYIGISLIGKSTTWSRVN